MSLSAFFSLIQYSEFPERGEFVNVGVALFGGRPPALVRFGQNVRRVQKMFGPDAGADIRTQFKAIEGRILSGFSGKVTRENVDRFIAMRAGNVRLSPARAVSCDDPVVTLNSLFSRFVEDKGPASRLPRPNRELTERFQLNGVVELLEKPEPFPLPQNVLVKADYGYQNSSYNYIKAISLRSDEIQAVEVAGKHAVIGSWLAREYSSKKLVVVADAGDKDDIFLNGIGGMMRDNGVDFYTMDQVNLLAEQIKLHAIEPKLVGMRA
ncbi:MAG: DUF3037 domain-containing protein [Methylobacterium sp.]|nr:DUF3037 domain-containing protein [Methylobacterium sp.]